MGAACCNTSASSGPNSMQDLPEVNVSKIKDPYARYEASLPFKRILLSTMVKKIDEADEKCGNTG